MSKKPILKIEDLSVHFINNRNINKAVDHVNLEIQKGEIISVVGESGSGKTTLGKAVLALLPFATGNIIFEDRTIPSTPTIRKRYNNQKWMANNIQMIFQDPYDSLHPTWTVEKVLVQGIKDNSTFDKEKKAFKNLKKIKVWQTYFEYTNNKQGLEVVNNLIESYKVEVVDKIDSIFATKIKELSDLKQKKLILESKKVLLRKAKTNPKDNKKEVEDLKLEILNLKKQISWFLKLKRFNVNFAPIIKFKITKAFKTKTSEATRVWYEQFIKNAQLTSVDLKDFKKQQNEINISRNKEFKKLKLEFIKEKVLIKKMNSDNKTTKEQYIQMTMTHKDTFHASKVKVIEEYNLKTIEAKSKFIDKHSKVNSWAMANFWIKNEGKRFSFAEKRRYINKRAIEIIESVGLNSSMLSSPASDLSGGQRQRLSIARTLLMDVKLLVADEPISALDVSIQAQVINILKKLIKKHDLSMLFIAHDLRMVKYISDRIYIMFRGKIVEYGSTQEIFSNPVHPYTKVIFSAIPSIDASKKGIEPYKYDLDKNLSEREDHTYINVSKDHFVLGDKSSIQKWKTSTKDFLKKYRYNE